MFTDPIVLTPDLAGSTADSASLPRVNNDGFKSVYRVTGTNAGEFTELSVAHNASQDNPGIPNFRHLVRLDSTKISSVGKPVKASLYHVTVEPLDGTFTVDDVINMQLQLLSFLMGFTAQSITDFDSGSINASNIKQGVDKVLRRLIARES